MHSLLAPQDKPYSPKRHQAQRMAWWYWALLDEMIAHPEMAKKDLADRFKVSVTCIQIVTTSDIFAYHLHERRRARAAETDARIHEKLLNLADKSIEHIATVLDKKRDHVPLEDLVKIADTTLERLGYGARGGGTTVNVNTGPTSVQVPVSLQELEEARRALRQTESMKMVSSAPPMIEGD